ncbi:hypothetical protein [Neoroseomonas oryzicola]|uniref:Uncharacterized protein n=1 Tax=Neoroseomonas oryzicola TaxID=535904 RepID=A0A9X9WDH4_9PROT|nr:hypothetical protein [Neoroseomonas oryzicola]MBR0658384.1 hypothetical protein [Neoroseomonas oryzicola]NKE18549.1 hypothetical protein [Neoroseomonas oryzicola]
MAPKRPAAGSEDPPLVFGSGRIGEGWIGIGITGAAFVVIGVAMLSAGAPEVMLAVGPMLALLAAACVTTREVRLAPEERRVTVTHRLLGIALTRRIGLDRFSAVTVTTAIYRSRFVVSDGTVEGDQKLMGYTVALRGGRRLRLDWFRTPGAPALAREQAEGLAVALAARLGLPARRVGYVVEAMGRAGAMTVPRKGAAEALV